MPGWKAMKIGGDGILARHTCRAGSLPPRTLHAFGTFVLDDRTHNPGTLLEDSATGQVGTFST
jgi:hypothetical protein